MALRADWLDSLVLYASDAAISVIDRDRIIEYANVGAAKMALRDSPSDLVGKSYIDILSESRILDEDGNVLPLESYPSVAAFADGKTTTGTVLSRIDPKRRHSWLEVSSVPLFDDAGKVEFVALFFRDITKRKLDQNRLEFLIKSHKILSQTTDLRGRLAEKADLLVPDLADWCTINIVSENGNLERVALTHRDASKLPLLKKLCEYTENPQEESAIYRVMQTGIGEIHQITEREEPYPSTAPSEVDKLLLMLQPVSAMIVPIIATGQTVGVLSLAYSDTFRRYTEDDMEFMREFGYHLGISADNARLYAELAKKDQMKDRFLAALSHELRNPLAPIKHSLETLKLVEVEPDVRKELDLIGHQFDHLTKLLRDLLDASRFTQAKIKLEKAPIELGGLIRATVSAQAPFIQKKGIELSASVADSLSVFADPLRIEQALINLLTNSAKFTPRGGKITVGAYAKGGDAVIEVEDTGAGIEKEDLNKVFDLYYQSESGKKISGMGIGLQLVKEIAVLHGGKITAKSEGAGKGSVFIMTIPLIAAIPDSKKESPAPAPHAAKKKILVIDDNEAAADSLVRLLSKVGHTASAAYTGADGVRTFNVEKPDIVIIDIGIPDMDGYIIVSSLRNLGSHSFKAIALSGYGQPEDKEKALSIGFDHHLTKPASLADISLLL